MHSPPPNTQTAASTPLGIETRRLRFNGELANVSLRFIHQSCSLTPQPRGRLFKKIISNISQNFLQPDLGAQGLNSAEVSQEGFMQRRRVKSGHSVGGRPRF